MSQSVLHVEIPPVLINDVAPTGVRPHAMTPYLESSSCILMELGIKELDLESVSLWIGELGDESPILKSPWFETIRRIAKKIVTEGGNRAFVAASPRMYLEGAPLVMIPTSSPAAASRLASSIESVLDSSPWKMLVRVQTDHKSVLIGTAETIGRVMQPRPAGRGDLSSPLTSADVFPHRAVISISDATRGNLVALWPDTLPGRWGVDLNPKQTMVDVIRMTLSMRLTPKLDASLKLETPDLAAMERTQEAVTRWISSRSGCDGVTVADEGTELTVSLPESFFAEILKSKKFQAQTPD
ncbi:hypothetical protein [Rubripirellula tenax]|nr:hypothetical protein [Rubripirellula tenax]